MNCEMDLLTFSLPCLNSSEIPGVVPNVCASSKQDAALAYKNGLMKKAFVHESMAKFIAKARQDGQVGEPLANTLSTMHVFLLCDFFDVNYFSHSFVSPNRHHHD